MDSQYHYQICEDALGQLFSPNALSILIKANLRQDGLFTGLVGHPEYHFDGPGMAKSNAYLRHQSEIIHNAIQIENNPNESWDAFGRLLHCVQDFYSHSNYLKLWIRENNLSNSQSLENIDCCSDEILNHPELICSKVYYPIEAITYFEIFRPFARKILPADSHANMNLDNPSRGKLFPLAIKAATLRTIAEYHKIIAKLTPAQIKVFKGI